MEDDKKEGSNPSTSKIEERSDISGQDMDEEEQDLGSNSYYGSSVYSGLSGTEIAGLDAAIPKVPRIMRNNLDRKERSGRRAGRVQKKRLRANTRRQGTRRGQKTTPIPRKAKRYRNLAATPFRVTSKVQNFVCQFCGHRCCRRDQRRRVTRKRRRRNIKRTNKRRRGRKNVLVSVPASVQVGSRSKMLSPLFLQTNDRLTDKANNEEHHTEITLTMISEAIKELSMWTQAVRTSAILKHLKSSESSDHQRPKKMHQVTSRVPDGKRPRPPITTLYHTEPAWYCLRSSPGDLRCPKGIVTQVSTDSWELSRDLPKRKSMKSHVTRFWEMYGDTMSPIKREDEQAYEERENASTSIRSNEVI